METYFDLLPEELLSIILGYLKKYNIILSYATFLSKVNSNLLKIFENKFNEEFPLIYPFIKEVINDDIYLNNNTLGLSNWTILYSSFICTYKNTYPEYRTILYFSEISNETIIHRYMCYNINYKIYKNIKKLEYFDYDGLNSIQQYFESSQYDYYSFHWDTIYNIISLNTDNIKISCYYISQNDKYKEIKKLLIENPEIKKYF